MNLSPVFQEYVRMASEALGPDVLRRPSVVTAPKWPHTTSAESWSRQFLIFAANQMGVVLPRVGFRYVGHQSHAGQIRQVRGTWLIDVSDRHRYDITALAAILAHELAHYVLALKGRGFKQERRNEELTDTTAVMAGFGHLMADAYQDRQKSKLSFIGAGIGIETQSSKLGYLSARDVRRLTRLRDQIASREPITVRSAIDVDLQSAYSCKGCGRRSRLPNVMAVIDLSCPTCLLRHRLRLRPSTSTWDRIRQWFRPWVS